MEHPHESHIIQRLLEPLSRSFTTELAQELVNLSVDREAQARIDELADKCTEGQLAPEELAEYETYISALEVISILQLKAKAFLNSTSAP
jgi:hypothetical protein